MRYVKLFSILGVLVLMIGILFTNNVFADGVAHTVNDHEQRLRTLEQAQGGDTTPPTLSINAPSEIHILLDDYEVSADVSDQSGISHVIFNILPDKNFIFAEPPFTLSKPYFPPNPGDAFKVNVIAMDNFGNTAKDFVTITRVLAPPELRHTGCSIDYGSGARSVSISNYSDRDDIGGFYVDVYFADAQPQAGDIGDIRLFVDTPMPPQSNINLQFDAPLGTTKWWVQVDTDNQIPEVDETDNISQCVF